MTEIDRLPVKGLTSRYNLGRTQLYKRLEVAGVKPTKEGKQAYVYSEQIAELDRLDEHIKSGGTLEDFHPLQVEVEPIIPMVNSSLNSSLVPSPTNLEGLIAAISTGVENAISASAQPVDPLATEKALDLAAEKGWLLSTSKVQQIIGVKPRTRKGEYTYERGNFVFTKSGKIGNQSAWSVHNKMRHSKP